MSIYYYWNQTLKDTKGNMIATLTNLAYLLPAYLFYKRKDYALSISFLLLTFSSTVYHYYAFLGIDYSFWRYMDMSSIYAVLGLLPYSVSDNKRWIWFVTPAIGAIANKFNLLFASFEPDSTIIVGLLALPTLYLASKRLSRDFLYTTLAFLGLSLVYSVIANTFSMTTNAYDNPHGAWHLTSAIVFTIIANYESKIRT